MAKNARWWTIDQMYRDMKRSRREGVLEKQMAFRRRLFWVVLGVWLSLLSWLARFMYLTTDGSVLKDPLLKGPPQFILLALIVALSAYLRQVRSSAVEQRDKIANGDLWNYPMDSPFVSFTERKLELLDSVANNLTLATPFFIILFVILTIRAGLDAIDRFRDLGGWVARALCVADFIIVIWVLAIFIAITLSHFRARFRDDRIRAVARDHEGEIIAKIRLEKARRKDGLTKPTGEFLVRSGTLDSKNREDLTAPANEPSMGRVWAGRALALALLLVGVVVLTRDEPDGLA